ncbi:hypothetical protein ACIGXM_11380 [Kitasatospora sp. NPDC052896]|uniref:hypothetical protein n=1 Tax=Kitasatospora sp. NPDC052896 TaxID=3364061 RepID=UPI0037C863DB
MSARRESLLEWVRSAPTPAGRPVNDPDQHHTGPVELPTQGVARIAAAPAHMPSEHEQAGHELHLATSLVLGASQAAAALDRFANGDELRPDGALVFASLLHITGRREAAQFWWQFAAGCGSATAAMLLHLLHLHLGETRDAAFWLAEADFLTANPKPAGRPLKAARSLLPDEVRRDILARSHHGLSPRLPAAMEAVINRLPVDSDDDDFGEIPRPDPLLTTRLGCRRT